MNSYLPYIQTAIVAIGGMLTILSLILGLERMIRIIMANYLIASILLGIGNFIDLLTNQLLIGEVERWVDGLQIRLGKILIAGKPTLLLTIYFVLLIFVINKVQIGIGKVKNEGMRRILTIIFLPCTVISIVVTLALAIYGNQVMDMKSLQILANKFIGNQRIHNFILLTPIRVIIPGIVTIIVAAFVIRKKDDIIVREIITEEKGDNI